MRHIMFLLAMILLAATSLAAQQTQPVTVTLNLSDTDVTEALTSISKQANVSVFGDSTVKGKITCSLSGVTAEEALDTICKMNKLEWYKTYANPGTDEKLTATKLFTLLEALKQLGGMPVVCEDPKTKTQTVYVTGAAGSVNTSGITTDLKLKQIYLVRAIPDPAVASNAQTTAALPNAAASDAKNAADQIYSYFSQMPLNMQVEAMHELRHKFYDSMTDEQRQQMRDMYRQQYGDRGPGGQGGPPGGWGRGGGPNNGQGGGHDHNQQPGQ